MYFALVMVVVSHFEILHLLTFFGFNQSESYLTNKKLEESNVIKFIEIT